MMPAMFIKRFIVGLMKFWAEKKIRSIAIVGDRFIAGIRSRIIVGVNSHVMIANHVSFHAIANVSDGAELTIGENTTIRFNTEINVARSIVIGRNVIISNNVVIADNDSHPTDINIRRMMCSADHDGVLWSNTHARCAPTVIDDDVWIGQRAMIMKGVHIGSGSIVAAGAVVTKNIPPHSLCFGNPAVIKTGKYLNVGD